MTYASEFRKNAYKIFSEEIIPIAKKFESERIKILKNARFFSLAGGILTFFIVLSFFAIAILPEYLARTFVSLTPILCIPVLLIPLWYTNIKKDFEIKVKEQIFPVVLRSLGNFEWCQVNIDMHRYDKVKHSGLFYGVFKKAHPDTNPNGINNKVFIHDDDVFTGSYKDIEITITDTELSYDGDKFFQGIIISLETPKLYKGTTIVQQNTLLRKTYFRKWRYDEIAPYLEQVNLEDSGFMKQFSVYATDQVEARYILTPSFMERLKQVSFAFDAKQTDLCIVNNMVWLAIKTNKDMFKLGTLTKSVYDFKEFQTTMNEITSILELIDELNLDVNVGL